MGVVPQSHAADAPVSREIASELLPVSAVIVTALLASALALVLAPFADTPQIFEVLFRRDEPPAAWVIAGVIVTAAGAATLVPRIRGDPVALLSRRPALFILVVTVCCAVAAKVVYRAHPLSMDEYAPLFQAQAFAHGKLAGHVPPELVPRLLPPGNWFLQGSKTGTIISTYWPGMALLLTPFVWLGAPWLLNPLIGGASLLVLWYLARKLFPQGSAPGWALLFATASPAFVVNAISYYSMSAHLLASLGYAALLLQPTTRSLVMAGVLGSVALSLHNPLPHTVFAIPFIVAIALRERRGRNLFALAVGYLPGTVLLVGGWLWFRGRMADTRADSHGMAATGEAVVRLAFHAVSPEIIWARTLGLAELALWAVPGLLAIAFLGFWKWRRNRSVILLASSAALTLLVYLFVPFDQGHGWGYRYFHSAWGVLPLLGAGALSGPSADRGFLARMMLIASLASLVLCNGLRFLQVRSFIDDDLAQIPEAPGNARFEVVFVRLARGYYSIDLVQNDPFLRGSRWMLLSYGPVEDERFMRRNFPRARIAAENDVATVWQVD
jgi:hypothetical protein